MRASRIAVAVWTLLFALLVVGVLASRIHRAARDAAIAVAPVPDPHELPMDYADPDVRSALALFETFTLGNGLDSLASKCRGNEEIYRVTRLPGLDLDGGDFRSVKLSIAGNAANLQTWTFGHLGPGDRHAWHVSAERTIDGDEAGLIRAAAENLLLAKLKVSDEPIIDAEEVTAETCYRGRYHFFMSRGARSEEAFVAFTNAMLAADKK